MLLRYTVVPVAGGHRSLSGGAPKARMFNKMEENVYRINEASGVLRGVWTDGRLSAEDLDRLTGGPGEADLRYPQYGRLRLLFRTDNFCGWDARRCLMSAMRFNRRHEARLERVALVRARLDWETCRES